MGGLGHCSGAAVPHSFVLICINEEKNFCLIRNKKGLYVNYISIQKRNKIGYILICGLTNMVFFGKEF